MTRKWHGPKGTVYLIHFDSPYVHARHYVGWSEDEAIAVGMSNADVTLPQRLEDHRSGRGSKLMAAVTEAGIGWHVARVWENVDRFVERKMHRRHCSARICPVCKEASHGKRRSAA